MRTSASFRLDHAGSARRGDVPAKETIKPGFGRTTEPSATMWSRWRWAAGATLVAMSLVSCATGNGTSPSSHPPMTTTTQDASNVKQLTERDNGTTVRLRVGGSMSITLPENPTTGYTWAVVDDGGALLNALPPTRDRASSAIGAGGHVTFAFVARTAGSGTISLKHSRPWEDPASAVGRFSVNVVVQGD